VPVAHRVAHEARDEDEIALGMARRPVSPRGRRQQLLGIVHRIEDVARDRAHGIRSVQLDEALTRRHVAVRVRERSVGLAHRASPLFPSAVQLGHATVALGRSLDVPVAALAVFLQHHALGLTAALVAREHLAAGAS